MLLRGKNVSGVVLRGIDVAIDTTGVTNLRQVDGRRGGSTPTLGSGDQSLPRGC